MTNTTTHTTFKRVAIGAHFARDGKTYRKASKRGGYALFAATDEHRPRRGQTHAVVPFARSTAVTAEASTIEG